MGCLPRSHGPLLTPPRPRNARPVHRPPCSAQATLDANPVGAKAAEIEAAVAQFAIPASVDDALVKLNDAQAKLASIGDLSPLIAKADAILAPLASVRSESLASLSLASLALLPCKAGWLHGARMAVVAAGRPTSSAALRRTKQPSAWLVSVGPAALRLCLAALPYPSTSCLRRLPSAAANMDDAYTELDAAITSLEAGTGWPAAAPHSYAQLKGILQGAGAALVAGTASVNGDLNDGTTLSKAGWVGGCAGPGRGGNRSEQLAG